jgi:prevent-host-death family protein
MVSVNATDAQNQLSELLERVSDHGERIQIEQQGEPVAAIISSEDLKRLEALEDAIDSALLRRAMAESEGFLTIEELLNIRSVEP